MIGRRYERRGKQRKQGKPYNQKLADTSRQPSQPDRIHKPRCEAGR